MAFIDIACDLVIYLCIVRVFLLHILAEIHSKYLNSSLAMPVFSKNLIFFLVWCTDVIKIRGMGCLPLRESRPMLLLLTIVLFFESCLLIVKVSTIYWLCNACNAILSEVTTGY